MERIKKLFFRLNKSNGGSAMVEVIVGFTILVLVIVECMVYIVGMSGKLVQKSKDVTEDIRVINEELYMTDTPFEPSGNIQQVDLVIDTDKTSEKNLVNNKKTDSMKLWLLHAKLGKYYSKKADLTVFRILYSEE